MKVVGSARVNCKAGSSSSGPQAYLGEEGLIDLHSLVGALRQVLPAAPPAVTHRRVGVGRAAEEHRPLVVELLLSLAHTLMNCHHGVIQICRD